jgi:hypothetical protein
MVHTVVGFEDALKKASDKKGADGADDSEVTEDDPDDDSAS